MLLYKYMLQAVFEIIDRIWARKLAFGMTFFVVFTLSYGFLFALDWLPEPPSPDPATAEEVKIATSSTMSTVESPTSLEVGEPVPVGREIVPTSIVIDSLGKQIDVRNPTSRSIADLDEALLSGVVRHPDSATLVDDGNIFILGHSSYLPNVLNRNFQAFNGIQNLVWGDTIRLFTNDTEYIYRVERVYEARASALTVPVAGTGRMLTLATCDSFGSTDDRFIVEARFISARSL